jgi:hypothetical protein
MPEEVTQDGYRIVRVGKSGDVLLQEHYKSFNQECFDNTLPFVPVCRARSIRTPQGGRANALYIPADETLAKRDYIVIDETLCGMFPFERLCLLHEMVHVKLSPQVGHGEEFIAEFKRVLDANKWEVLGCIDECVRFC